MRVEVIKQDTFETVYTRLEEAVQRLEDGGLPLDEAISLFEQGMRVAKLCQELLDGAELRVTTLIEEFKSGGMTLPGDEAEDEDDF